MSTFPRLAPPGCAAALNVFGKGWDRSVLGGWEVPGRTRVTGGGIKLKHDKKSRAGGNGGRLGLLGLDPQQFDLEIEVQTDEQLDFLLDLCRRFVPQTKKLPAPVTLDHPSLYHLGDVVNVQVIGATPLEVKGRVRTMKLHLLHWLKDEDIADSVATTPTKPVKDQRRERAEQIRAQQVAARAGGVGYGVLADPNSNAEPGSKQDDWAPPTFATGGK